jgi:raffinose/stachyose/melibiose transport system substrate-binding protein
MADTTTGDLSSCCRLNSGRHMPRRPFAAVAGLMLAAATVAACGSTAKPTASPGSAANARSSGAPAVLNWWNNATSGSLLTTWQQAAAAFHAAHPNVEIKNVPIQNEELQDTKIPLALQSNDPPQIFQQWGGGREASEIPSGKLMDMTSATKSWIGELGSIAQGWQVNGKVYGVPYDTHVVGFWYRKDLFAKAGITATPTTIAELDADITKLKADGIAPVAVGSKDQWPDAFWYEEFAVRECSNATLQQAMKSVSLSAPCFKKAGSDLTAFMQTKPFQAGFLATPAQQGAGSSAGMVANGKAAMELQGDWEPGVIQPLTSDKNILNELGWFAFPTVPGGAGDPTTVLGGGDGMSCSTKATSACPEFLKYIDSVAVQQKVAQANVGLPANPAAASAVTEPALKQAVAAEKAASYVQTYFDVAFPVSVGTALDSAIANFFAGQGDITTIVQSVSQGK